MGSVTAMAGEFLRRNLLGDNIDEALQKIGKLCKTGEAEKKWSALNKKALEDCSALAKTCVKVSAVALMLPYILPFLFGSVASFVGFSSLFCCVLTYDVADMLDCFSRLDSGDDLLTPSFKECVTEATRVTFMLKSTWILQYVPGDLTIEAIS